MKNIGQYIFNEIENSDYFKSLSEKILINYSFDILIKTFNDNINMFKIKKFLKYKLILLSKLIRYIILIKSSYNQIF